MKNKSAIVKEMYIKLLPMVIFGIIVNAINSLIDSIVTEKVLGTVSLSAVGLFGPMATIIGVTSIIVSGIQILCGQYIGACKKKKIKSLFSSGVIFLALVAILITIVLLLFTGTVAKLLGADDPQVKDLLMKYIRGYSLGIIGQVFSGFMIQLLPYNNKIKLGYLGIGLLVTINISLDFIFAMVFHMGTFGMGLATSLSFLISSGVMFTGVLNSENTIYFRFGKVDFKLLLQAAYRGLPGLAFTLGVSLKGLILNRTLMSNIGYEMVAVMNVQGTLCAFLGAIPFGVASAYLSLASIFYGEEDKRSFLAVFKYAMIFGIVLSTILVILLMGGSTIIASFYFDKTEKSWDLCREMLLYFPIFLILNAVYSILAFTYHCEGRMKIVTAMSAITQLTSVMIALIGLRTIGTNGVWLSYPLNEVLGITILLTIAFIHSRKISFHTDTVLMLDNSFGADDNEFMEFSIHSMEEVVGISQQIQDFYISKGIDKTKSKYTRLCVEELVGNVIEHGFITGEKHNVDVRIVSKEGDKITIRVRDDCKAFDPKKRLDQLDEDDMISNIGMRIIFGLTDEVIYNNNMNINTLIVKVS